MFKKKTTGIWIFGVIFALFFCCIGVSDIVQGVQYMHESNASAGEYETISAEITDIVAQKVGTQYTHDVYVTYTYDGKTYENIRLNVYSSSMYIGQTIDIQCNREHPERIKGKLSIGEPGIWITGLGVAFVFAGLAAGIAFLKVGRKARNSAGQKRARTPGAVEWKQNGFRLTGKVERVVAESGNYGNRKKLYAIICTYLESSSNTLYRFNSDFLLEDPSDAVYPGMPIDIYVNPANYSQYYVDIQMIPTAKIVDFS